MEEAVEECLDFRKPKPSLVLNPLFLSLSSSSLFLFASSTVVFWGKNVNLDLQQ